MKTNSLLLLAALASTATFARGESALLLKETVPANTPSQSWSWCRVFADHVEISGEADGRKSDPVKRDVLFDADVKGIAALQALIEGADVDVPVKAVTTDSGGVRLTGYRPVSGAEPKKIVLKISGDEEASNPTAAAKTLVGFINRNCPDAEAAETSFPDYLSLSCTFESPSGSQGFQFKPSEGAVETRSGEYVARCEPVKGARAACSIFRTGSDESALARKVFDPAGEGVTVEAGQSLRLVCRANS
jgi:hypothetical protein